MAKTAITPFGVSTQGPGGTGISAGPGGVSISKPSIAQIGDVKVNAGVGIGPSGVKPGATVQIGDSPGAAQGSNVGGTAGSLAGAAVGGPVGALAGSVGGSAVGSAVGDLFSGNTQAQKETKARDSVFSSFNDGGLLDDHKLTNPDGSVWDVKGDRNHDWKYGDKKVNDIGERQLFSYEADYTNDLDYLGSMAGITLSRLFAGGKGKGVDQAGNSLGNAFLGKLGYGADFTKENFAVVTNNARAAYGRAGIQSKDDLLALANKAFSEGRINDSDYGVTQQVAGLVFDDNFSLGQQLMAGRWDGLKTASKTPTSGAAQTGDAQPANRPGRIYSPVISPEEALLSVKPFFDFYKANYPVRKPSSSLKNGATAAQIIGGVTAGAGLYNTVNKATNSGLGDFITGLGSGVRGLYDDIFGGEDGGFTPPETPDVTLDEGGSGILDSIMNFF